MTVLASDSFNRTDSTTTLGTTDSYNGGTAYAWTPIVGTWGISSNQAYEVTVTNDGFAVIDVGQADVDITVTLTIGAVVSGIYFRATDSNNFWRFIGVGTTALYLQKKSAGSMSTISNIAATVANGDTIRVTAQGSTITLYHNGTSIGTATNTFNQTVTKHGIGVQGVSNNNTRFDNFEIDSLATGGTNASITSVAATSTNNTVAPVVSTTSNVAINAVIAGSTENAVAPSVSTQSQVSINSVGASTTAQAVSPVVSAQQQVSIAGVVANSAVSAVVPSIYTGTSISVSVGAVAASATNNAVNPTIGTSSNVSIVAAVTNATAIAIAPIVSTICNVVMNPVVALLMAVANAPTVLLNSSQIIGRIELKGSRDLNVPLKGNRDLYIYLKGSL